MSLRDIKLYNYGDAFVSGSLGVAVPLFLLSENLDLPLIGLILSFSPLFFTSIRLLFALFADVIGVRFLFFLNVLSHTLGPLCYLIPHPFAYALGKMWEGTAHSSIWSVNRTALIFVEPDLSTARDESNSIQGVRNALAAISAVITGVFIVWFGYQLLFISLSLLSLLRLPFLSGIPDSRKTFFSWHMVSRAIDFHLQRRLILPSFIMMFRSLATVPIIGTLLPIFLTSVYGFSPDMTGLFITIYGTIVGASAVFSRRLNNTSVSLFSLLYPCGIVGFLLSPPPFSLISLLVAAIGDGVNFKQWESIIFSNLTEKHSLSWDVAFLHTPEKVATFIAVMGLGVAVQWYGYYALFLFSAILFVVFVGAGHVYLLRASLKGKHGYQ